MAELIVKVVMSGLVPEKSTMGCRKVRSKREKRVVYFDKSKVVV